jgi:hypothetical protein
VAAAPALVYRRFAVPKGSPIKATDQLRVLDGYAGHYRQLVSGNGDDPIAAFGRHTAVWDASSTHPMALRIANSGLSPDAQAQMYDDIVSYFVRRAICG